MSNSMKIGIAGPISLNMLNVHFYEGELPEKVRSFPLMAHIVNGLCDLGHEIIIYTTAHNIGASIVLKKENITVCIANRSPSPGKRFFRDEINNLTELMKKYPADLINAQWTYEYALAALKSGLPTIVTVRDYATKILKYQFDAYRLVRWILNYRTLNSAKYLITNSQYLKNKIHKNRKKIKVIPNFYSSNLEQLFEKDKPESKKIVSVSNGFGKIKNIKNGILAFSKLRKKYKDLEYHLIGSQMGEGSDAFQFAMKHNALEGITFKGVLDFKSVIEEIRTAKILLHPSREESFGNSVLEAMIIGIPVVGGSKSGNIPFLLKNGETGITCDVNSPDNISLNISKLLDDKDRYAQIRSQARIFAQSNFNKEIVINQLIEYYSEVLSSIK